MAKSVKNKSNVQRNQLLIVMAVFAVLGVLTSLFVLAKQGNVGGGNVSIGGVSSCAGTVWTINARAQSSNVALVPVDIFDDSTVSGSGFRMLASNISLPFVGSGNFYTFQAVPQPGTQKYTMYVVGHGGNPAHEAIFASTRMVNPCI